jgi:hypothetical protein
METTFSKRAGQFCRTLILAVILFTSINAKFTKNIVTSSFTIKSTNDLAKSSLTDFRGEMTRNKKVALKWKAADGFTPVAYTVEKSRDGETFTAVKTAGVEVDKSNTFLWTDNFPKATNCYRLKMTHADGNVSYSKTLVVETYKGGDVIMVGATPQVNINDIQVDVQLRELAFINLNITDEKGDIVLQQKEKGKTGINQFAIAGSRDLKPGDYFLKVVVNGSDRMMVHLIKS